INTDKSTSSGLKSVTSSNKTDYQTLEYGEVISAGEKLYLTWSGNIRIFTIEIKIQDAGDVTPEVREVTLDRTSLSLYVDETDYLTATVEMTIGDFEGTYEWSTSDETIVRVEGSGNGATVIAVNEGTATIIVTAGEKSAVCVVTVSAPDESVIERVYVDFGESSTYTWISSTITSGETYSDPLGILTLHAGGNTAISSDHLNTGGGSSSGNNRYFSIDLSGYIGYVFSIEVTMTSNSSENRSVCLDTQYTNAGSTESNTTLAFATSSSASDKQKLEYMAEITDANKTLYLTCDKSVNYYTIDIKILDPGAVTPEVQGVTLSDSVLILEAGGTGSLTATVKMNIGDYEGEYEWTSSDGGVVTVDGTSASPTITAVGAGTATITVIVGGYSVECLVVVSAEGEEATYEWIYNEFDYARALSDNGTTATTESYTQGIFTVNAGANFEDEDFNTQKADVTMALSGITNNISFTAKGGSGSGNSVVKLYLVNEDGSRKDVTPSDWPVDGVAQNISGDFTASGLIGGTYVITTSYTARIYSLKVEQFVAVSDPVGISATAGTVDFLKGRDVSVDDLKLNIMLDYENGRQDPIDVSNVTVSLVSSNLSVGRNEITITYYYTYEDDTGASNTKEFTTSVYIYVYSIDYLTISDFSMEKSSSTYITHNVQKVFLMDSEVNYDYAAVTATATCTYTDDDGKTVALTSDFIMTEADGLVFSNNANTSVAGTYLVTATANMGETEGDSKTASYDIHVVDATNAEITTVNVIHPTEDSDGTEIETATYAPDTVTGIISVSTITDAIQLIKLMGATDAERKYIYVGEGQYWEKIYIDIPNLSLIGSNSSDTNDLATRQETTEIVYWAYNGLMDPSGTTTFSTVGSATVTVANTATDFYAANITFRNYWNTNELYGECKTYTSDTQADAAYINADRAHFYNVTFTGYHDTLEAENGRQYYDHCYIEGRTDYIFGDTATCYFKDCTIHTIGADSSSNGGYVTAVKGGSMTYGYVFDGCNFTSDLKSYYTTGGGSLAVPYEGFAYTEEGTVSLGRTWNSSNMHVAVINSTLDAGYSKTAYGTSGKNPRYTDMSGYAPTPAYLVEYNNSGAGSITEDLTNTCSMLTAEQAANYTITNIFAAENGGMSYSGSWDPSTEKTITVTVKDSTGVDVAKIYATNSITVSNLMNAVNARLTDAEVEALYDESGNEITETIGDSTTVYIATKEPDSAIKENLYYEYSDFAALTTSDDGTYSLGGITIDLGTSGAFYSNNDDKWYVLTGTTKFTLQVKAGTFIDWWAYQEDTLTLKINGTETSFTSTDTTSECLYTYRATEDATIEIGVVESKTAYIKYIAVNMMFGEGTTDLVSGWPDANYTIQSTVGYYSGMKVDATGDQAKLALNGSADWLQINAGTKLTFSVPDGATVTATFYNQNTDDATYYSIGDVTGGFCTISVLTGTYISAITITIAK
ncbi:MAG: pectinesterase family protein, partial [Bacteroidales bacterium]|nr:pectinesterase family protein [Bacteroidales bacterium]